jgi:hypothetical protein
MLLRGIHAMSKNEPAAEWAALAKLREIEDSAAELVQLGDLLFRGGEPSDPVLLRRYQLHTRVKAAVALPFVPERVAALQAAKMDREH